MSTNDCDDLDDGGLTAVLAPPEEPLTGRGRTPPIRGAPGRSRTCDPRIRSQNPARQPRRISGLHAKDFAIRRADFATCPLTPDAMAQSRLL